MLISIPYLLLIGAEWGFILLSLAECVGMGFITRAIMKSKNREGGFAWGFFLAVIGIIVCASKRRIVYDPPTRIVNNYLSDMPLKKESEPPKPVTWKCENCGRENENASKFCADCGERRHYKWVCAKCNSNNAADVRICPECGSTRSDEQEFVPGSRPMSEDFLSEAQQMETAAEIADAFTECFGASEDENVQMMAALLNKTAASERVYHNMKKIAMDKLTAFFEKGMLFYPVDRSSPTVTCPVCGKVMSSVRSSCFSCGALFRE